MKAHIGQRDFDKQIHCKCGDCEYKVTKGDWCCELHKDRETIWKTKCLNCGEYHTNVV